LDPTRIGGDALGPVEQPNEIHVPDGIDQREALGDRLAESTLGEPFVRPRMDREDDLAIGVTQRRHDAL
jgi:hypothetical protein